MRREGTDGVCCARQVDVDRDLPVRILHLEQRMKALDAGIGEQNVDAAEFAFRSDSSCPQSGQVALVEFDAQPAAPACEIPARTGVVAATAAIPERKVLRSKFFISNDLGGEIPERFFVRSPNS